MTHILSSQLTRREMLALGLGAAASTFLTKTTEAAPKEPNATPSHLPRWRGFNLLEKFTLDGNAPYQESDFDMIARWGFNFVRLPTDYRIWTKGPGQYDEAMLKTDRSGSRLWAGAGNPCQRMFASCPRLLCQSSERGIGPVERWCGWRRGSPAVRGAMGDVRHSI